MQTPIAAALAAAVLCAAPGLAAERYTLDRKASAIRFSVPYILFVLGEIEGEFRGFDGDAVYDREDLAASKVRVRIDAGSLDTRFEPRDFSLRGEGFFAVERFPHIIFESSRVERLSEEYLATGPLELRGISREVRIPFRLLDFGDTVVVLGSMKLKRQDFGIEGPIESDDFQIGDEVTVRLQLVLYREPAG